MQRRFHKVLRDRGTTPKRVLEVGGRLAEGASLLRFPEIASAERWCINLLSEDSRDGITQVTGSANDMHMFDDGSFDLVMCNAMLEHDMRFWLSISEMHRVLAPGGLLVIGVPGFVKDPERDRGASTDTFRYHFGVDYYRFSPRAVREVFLDGMEEVRVTPILHPPRIIGVGVKPHRPVGSRSAGGTAAAEPASGR